MLYGLRYSIKMTYSKMNKKSKEIIHFSSFWVQIHFKETYFKFLLFGGVEKASYQGIFGALMSLMHQWNEDPKDSSRISICRVLAIFILKGQFSNKTKHPLLCNPCLDLGFCTLWKWHGNPCRSTVTILHLQLSFWLVGTTKDLSARPY